MPGPFIGVKGCPRNELHMPEPQCCNSSMFYCLAYGLSRGAEDLRALWDAEEVGFTRHICFADPSNPARRRKD